MNFQVVESSSTISTGCCSSFYKENWDQSSSNELTPSMTMTRITFTSSRSGTPKMKRRKTSPPQPIEREKTNNIYPYSRPKSPSKKLKEKMTPLSYKSLTIRTTSISYIYIYISPLPHQPTLS